MVSKSFYISDETYINSNLTNCIVCTYGNGFYALPELQTTLDNYHWRSTALDADRVIGFPNAYVADGKYVIVASYDGDGFGVHQLTTGGTLTNVYTDDIPANNYRYYHALAVDKTRKVAYIGNYVYDNLIRYDFNGNWENTPTKTVITEASNGLPSDEVGSSYINGLAIAGDWLYISPDDKNTAGFLRWNTQTESAQTMTVNGYISYSDSGWIYYDEPNDRIYSGNYSRGSGLFCIVSASTDNAVAYAINIAAAGGGTNTLRQTGVAVDPINPNHIWVGPSYRCIKIDITNCILDPGHQDYTNIPIKLLPTGTPTIHNFSYPYYIGASYWRIGGLTETGLVYIIGDRGWGGDVTLGFVDQASGEIAYIPNALDYRQDHNNYGADYGTLPIKLTDDNSNEWWVWSAYGSDGYSFTTWSADTYSPVLQENWQFETIAYTLDGNAPVRQVILDKNIPYFEPAGTSGTHYVSNNNGSTWEVYSGNFGDTHIFTTQGYQFKYKFVGVGTTKTSPFFRGQFFAFFLSSDNVSVKPRRRRNNRTQSFKLAGN